MGGTINHLQVDTDQAYAAARAIGNDAEELRDELASLQQEWDNLSRGWSGVASSAYSSIWAEWREGAVTLIDALAESSHKLGVAAVQYSEQDATAADAVDTSTLDLGL